MISYFGGKARMGEWIYPFIPKNITTYVEPFSGAFWIYFNTKNDFTHCDKVVYNDINKYMLNLMCCAKDHQKLLKKIEDELKPGGLLHNPHEFKTPEYKQVYKDLYYHYKHCKDDEKFLEEPNFEVGDYDAAVKYAFLITSSFNGCIPKAAGFSGVSTNGKYKLQTFINKLNKKEYQEKLESITDFELMDFDELIKKYDSEETYFYLDPPYFDPKGKRLDWYGVKDDSMFGVGGHERLANLLQNTKAKWSLSYYNYPQLEKWYPNTKYNWESKDFFRSSASFSDNKDVKGTEILIMNYNFEEEEYKNKMKKSIPTIKEKFKDCTEEEFPNRENDEILLNKLKDIGDKMNENDDFWN